MNKYIQINEKHLSVPLIFYICARTYCLKCRNWIPIRTYISHMLVRFNIRRYFSASLSVRVSDSGQTVNCYRNYCIKRNCHNIYNYTQSRFTFHHKLLYNHMVQDRKIFWYSLSAATYTILQDKTVTIYKTTHTQSSHAILHFYIQQNLCRSLNQFKNRCHKVGSIFTLV